jgi:hypothetical protein
VEGGEWRIAGVVGGWAQRCEDRELEAGKISWTTLRPGGNDGVHVIGRLMSGVGTK